MKWLLLLAAAACLAGCSKSDPDMKDPGPQTMLNPSAKPRTSQEQQMADERREFGQKQNDAMAAAAQQMKAAQARTAGH